ncbi:hypothetical protein CCR85_00680 [Rhodothalassium salexigens]|uniref:LuxR family transcriptional regulator n=1 Tax=Rhodothalassium salexigens TaxID=1086 RepID=UPI001911321C|nr:LuxR family transcriptional regulator [Rhodothalassium salexigens]MBK5910009.1 hypothetical protein [Rhodothalassium salexigens]MBK5921583.1 hypothetical protein [Rhodothalassium salexigens]
MDLGDYISAMAQAGDTATLQRVFVSALAREGVDWFAYARSFDPSNPDMNEADYRLGNFPEMWAERYFDAGYDASDPVRLYAFRTAQPFTWGEAEARIGAERPVPPILDEAANVGLSAGATIALFGPGGRLYSVSFGAAQPGLEREWDLNRLGILAHQLHLTYERLTEPDPVASTTLTVREQDVLHWCARGKSNTDISEIMGISPNTVDYYMRRIYNKLGVNSRTPAALMGIMTGMIQP